MKKMLITFVCISLALVTLAKFAFAAPPVVVNRLGTSSGLITLANSGNSEILSGNTARFSYQFQCTVAAHCYWTPPTVLGGSDPAAGITLTNITGFPINANQLYDETAPNDSNDVLAAVRSRLDCIADVTAGTCGTRETQAR